MWATWLWMIEYCLDNVDSADREALLNAGTEVREKPCLDLCGFCYDHAFLLVEGQEIAAGEDHLQLLERHVEREGI